MDMVYIRLAVHSHILSRCKSDFTLLILSLSDVNKATTFKANVKTKNVRKCHSSHLIKAWHCLS